MKITDAEGKRYECDYPTCSARSPACRTYRQAKEVAMRVGWSIKAVAYCPRCIRKWAKIARDAGVLDETE